jgi:hypothetical protein
MELSETLLTESVLREYRAWRNTGEKTSTYMTSYYGTVGGGGVAETSGDILEQTALQLRTTVHNDLGQGYEVGAHPSRRTTGGTDWSIQITKTGKTDPLFDYIVNVPRGVKGKS